MITTTIFPFFFPIITIGRTDHALVEEGLSVQPAAHHVPHVDLVHAARLVQALRTWRPHMLHSQARSPLAYIGSSGGTIMPTSARVKRLVGCGVGWSVSLPTFAPVVEQRVAVLQLLRLTLP
jgi:hypothetical protein